MFCRAMPCLSGSSTKAWSRSWSRCCYEGISSIQQCQAASQSFSLRPPCSLLLVSLSLFTILLCIAILILFERLPHFGSPVQKQQKNGGSLPSGSSHLVLKQNLTFRPSPAAAPAKTRLEGLCAIVPKLRSLRLTLKGREKEGPRAAESLVSSVTRVCSCQLTTWTHCGTTLAGLLHTFLSASLSA